MLTLPRRELGSSGLMVSALGFGAGHIGGAGQDDQAIKRLLHQALDWGINLIDTARGYGQSEERIGRFLSGRRRQIILSTKVGYDEPGYTDWTGPIIGAGVAAALKRLRTDYLDIVHLHSCPRDVLERGEVVEALAGEVQAGRVRVAAYSGDNEALDWAIRSGRFGSVQCSLNIADQRVLHTALPEATARNLGVIAKRPLANAPWRFCARPVGDYAEVYWERLQHMDLAPPGMAWSELALRFAVFQPGVHSAIVGTARPDHLERNIEFANRGPLPAGTVDEIRAAFDRHDRNWTGQT
jgi:aryl-alcohol dehydrogenase-like predicted oxidoreductase